MTDPVTLLIDALAIFRISRLVTADTILDAPRGWLLRRWPGQDTEFFDSEVVEVRNVPGMDNGHVVSSGTQPYVVQFDTQPNVWIPINPRWIGSFIECIWCVSVWVAIAVVAARQWWDWWQWPALVAAGSAAAGWIHSRSQ